jgi:methionine-rich copper-binding protein CopC
MGTLLLCVFFGVPRRAAAHALLVSSDPAEGAHLADPPNKISLTFEESPSEQGSIYKVIDGCHRNIVSGQTVSGDTVDVGLAKGQPGTWKINYKTVSATDGHVVSGDFLILVAGKKDCKGGGGGGGQATEPTTPSGSGVPWLPLLGGTAVLIVIAVMVRRSTAR